MLAAVVAQHCNAKHPLNRHAQSPGPPLCRPQRARLGVEPADGVHIVRPNGQVVDGLLPTGRGEPAAHTRCATGCSVHGVLEGGAAEPAAGSSPTGGCATSAPSHLAADGRAPRLLSLCELGQRSSGMITLVAIIPGRQPAARQPAGRAASSLMYSTSVRHPPRRASRPAGCPLSPVSSPACT